MADSVAAALNTLAKETLTLPREDEEQLQLFIADFFTTPDDYDDYSSDEAEHLAPHITDQHYSSNTSVVEVETEGTRVSEEDREKEVNDFLDGTVYHQTAETEENREEEANFIVDGFLDATVYHQTADTEEDREEEVDGFLDATVYHQTTGTEDREEEAEDPPLISDNVQPALEAALQVVVEFRNIDLTEEHSITSFADHGCNCALGPQNTPCCRQISVSQYSAMRSWCAELTKNELDMVVLGQCMAYTDSSELTAQTSVHRNSPHPRQRSRSIYHHQGLRVCRTTFLFVHGIKLFRFKALRHHLNKNGLVARVHGNTSRLPKHALTLQDVQQVIGFITNFAEDHAIMLPGRIPGYKRYDLQLLPCSTTRSYVWKAYTTATANDTSIHTVAYSTFCCLWRQLLPQILPARPRTDLCEVCHKSAILISRSSNLSEADKTQALRSYEAHLQQAETERSAYKAVCKKALKTYETYLESTQAVGCSVSIADAHYSFDFAQQVHIPSDPFQPGPVYFLTPRKCALFGVCCEAIPKQVNYLIDEGAMAGKGANTVVSLLHHFFDNHSLNESSVHLNADNCTGQNKNNTMIHYLIWRVLTGRHQKISLSFLLPGHTKFSPDWGFGLLKQRFRKDKVNSLDEMVATVNASAKHNCAQLAGKEDGTIYVQTYNWDSFFSPHLKKMDRIKKYHHFTVKSEDKGIVYRKISADGDENSINLLKHDWEPEPSVLPSVIPPPGLSASRQWYLYDKIRDFCTDETKDTVCPLPNVPRPTTDSRPQSPVSRTPSPDPPPKRRRLCSVCGQSGHNARFHKKI